MASDTKPQLTPTEIAHGAVDRLCDYDAWDAPGSYDSTAERIGEFMQAFVGIAAARLAGAVEHQGDRGCQNDSP